MMWRLDSLLRKHAWWRKWRGLPEPKPLSPVMKMMLQEALRQAARPDSLLAVLAKQPVSNDGGTIRIRMPNQYARRTQRCEAPEPNGKRHPH
jgi:hypothetical protein